MWLEWTKEEFKTMRNAMKNTYDVKWNEPFSEPIDFEGNILCKTREGYRVMSWELDELYFKGSLEECCKYICK